MALKKNADGVWENEPEEESNEEPDTTAAAHKAVEEEQPQTIAPTATLQPAPKTFTGRKDVVIVAEWKLAAAGWNVGIDIEVLTGVIDTIDITMNGGRVMFDPSIIGTAGGRIPLKQVGQFPGDNKLVVKINGVEKEWGW